MSMLKPTEVLAGAAPGTTHVFGQPDAASRPRTVAPIDVAPATVPGLAAHESAYRIGAAGPAFVVALHRVPPSKQGWHVVEIRGREVDPTTGATIGEPLPSERHSYATAQVSEGTVTLTGIRDEQAARMAERLLHHRTHASAFAALPLIETT